MSSPSHLKPLLGMEYLKDSAERILSKRKEQGLLRTLPKPSSFHHSDRDKKHLAQSGKKLRDLKESYKNQWQETAHDLAQRLLQTRSLAEKFNFNLNDYLGLERSGVFVDSQKELAAVFPLGGLSSRLIGGNHLALEILEELFSQQLESEKALYFHSGTLLNQTLPHLLELLASDHLQFFSDQHNHASIVHGITATSIAKSRRKIFPHLDFETLHHLLEDTPVPVQVVFLEGLYSMEGNHPQPLAIERLLQNKRVVLVLDEAHSLGTMGKKGGGFLEVEGLTTSSSAILGVYPCGKALASGGALLTAADFFQQVCINFAKPWIYSTAPSPLAAACLSLRLLTLPHLGPLRRRLQAISLTLSHDLTTMGYEVRGRGSPILTLIFSCSHKVMNLEKRFKQHGLDLKALRYPTVPHHSPRLRLSLHPFLEDDDLKFIKKVFEKETS